jgi:O-antigen/teichoic acid export membrane protein
MDKNKEASENENVNLGQKKIKKNYALSLIYQITAIVIPIVTGPYLARVLTANGIGIFSYSNSVMTYFSIFAAFGFSSYAQREIAKCQGDIKKQSSLFWGVYLARLITTAISLLVYFVLFAIGLFGDYSFITLLLTINVVSTALDITFFFQGNERFNVIVGTSLLVKFISTILIFCLVRSFSDLWIYVLIVTLSTFIGHLLLSFFLINSIHFVPLREVSLWPHIKFSFRFFIPTIAISAYVYVDKLMLGLLVPGTYEESVTSSDGVVSTVTKKYSDLENGFYYQADKIITLCYTVITSLGSVMGSRNANEIAKGNFDLVRANIYKAMRFIWLISFPMAAGLFAVAPLFVPIFFGSGYEKVVILLQILAAMIPMTGFASLAGYHYLIPAGRENSYTLSLLLMVAVDIIANGLLIPAWKLYSTGAAIASVIASFACCILLVFFIRKFLSIRQLFVSGVKYFICSLLMGAVVFTFCYFAKTTVWFLIGAVTIGFAFYLIELLVLKDPLILGGISAFINKHRKKEKS